MQSLEGPWKMDLCTSRGKHYINDWKCINLEKSVWTTRILFELMNEGIHLDLDTWIVPGQIRKANLGKQIHRPESYLHLFKWLGCY